MVDDIENRNRDPQAAPPGGERSNRVVTVPNIICAIRLVGSLVLVASACAGHNEIFLWLFVALAMSDWIDGKLAGKTPVNPWDKPKAVDLTQFTKPGVKHQLVIRVVKNSHAAGVNGRVRLMEASRTIGDR